jgi:hypothetical protein
MRLSTSKILAAVAIFGLAHPASADVIADWNENAVSYGVLHSIGPPPAERIIAMTQLAMFDAVNSIERKYRPYLVQLPATPGASKDAAAAAAAGSVLAGISPQTQATMKSLLESYLAAIPDSSAKAEGIKLGEAVAAKILGRARGRWRKGARHLSAPDHRRRIRINRSHGGPAVAEGQAFRADQRVAIPPRSADRARQCGMGFQLQ